MLRVPFSLRATAILAVFALTSFICQDSPGVVVPPTPTVTLTPSLSDLLTPNLTATETVDGIAVHLVGLGGFAHPSAFPELGSPAVLCWYSPLRSPRACLAPPLRRSASICARSPPGRTVSSCPHQR
jgi:hypothetical protein